MATLLSPSAELVRRDVEGVPLSPAPVAQCSPGAAHVSIEWVALLIEFPDPHIVLDALFSSARRSATRIAIVGHSVVVVERSIGDHRQGIAMEADDTRLTLLVWASADQLPGLLARLDRRVMRLVWPPGSATLTWVGGAVWLSGGPYPPFDRTEASPRSDR